MAPQAGAYAAAIDFHVGIVHVLLASTVASFASQRLVRVLLQFLELVGMAFLTGLFAGEHRLAVGQLDQRRASVPPVLVERGRGQETAGGAIDHDDADDEQEQPEHLGRHLKEASHSSGSTRIVFHIHFVHSLRA